MLKPQARTAVAILLIAATLLPGCLGSGSGLFGGDDEVDPLDYLRDSKFTTWHIEVDHTPDQEPRPSALTLLEDRLRSIANKDRITIAVDGTLPSKTTWTTDDLVALQKANQDKQTSGKTVVTYVAYVDGKLRVDNEDRTVLGLTIGHDFVVIFKEQTEAACSITAGAKDPRDVTGPLDLLPCYGGEERIEQAVLMHEFGHAMGLVNRGIPMVKDHEGKGADQQRHSNNPDSVMYWALDSAGTLDEFTSQIPLHFDADDKADVCAAGGRC